MTGRREIQRLRAARAAREGDAFDIRRFHDDVLRHGKLPLRILADACSPDPPSARRPSLRPLVARPIPATAPEDPMTPPDHAAAVNALADRFWEAILEQHPTTATVYGDDRCDDRLDDPRPPGGRRPGALRDATLAELAAIPVDGLPVEERITHDMLRVVCELGNEADDLRMDLVGLVDQIDGPQALLPQGVQFQPADTPARLEKLLARLAGLRALHRRPPRPPRGGARRPG